jgi:hypothetical protein
MSKIRSFDEYQDYYITVQEKKCEKKGFNIKLGNPINSPDDILMIRDYLKNKYTSNDTHLFNLSNSPYSPDIEYKSYLVMDDSKSKIIILKVGKMPSDK